MNRLFQRLEISQAFRNLGEARIEKGEKNNTIKHESLEQMHFKKNIQKQSFHRKKCVCYTFYEKKFWMISRKYKF